MNQPYFSREGMAVKVCSPWSDRLSIGCINKLPMKWTAEETDEKTVRVLVGPPLAPEEDVIAPAFRIMKDNPDYTNSMYMQSYGQWWDCSQQVMLKMLDLEEHLSILLLTCPLSSHFFKTCDMLNHFGTSNKSENVYHLLT